MTKYLKYAFGEIVLVVVGILIALQVNNWNEQRSKDRKADKILVLMQDELLDAVVNIDRQRNSYRRKDSIYRIINSDTLTLEDYMDKSNFNIHRMTYTFHPIRIQNEGYKSFVDQVDGFSNRYSDLIPQIKALYSNFDFYIEDTQQKVKDIVEQQYAYAKTQKWYSSVWTSNELTPEFAEYLINDYHYKNQAEAYIIYAQGLMGVCTKFQKEAVDLYKELSKITGYPKELPESIQNYYSSKPQSFIDELVGEYQPIDNTLTNSVRISYKDDQLLLNNEKAYLIKDNYIISVLEYPTANLWQYDESTKELVFSQLMPSTSKRKKIDD